MNRLWSLPDIPTVSRSSIHERVAAASVPSEQWFIVVRRSPAANGFGSASADRWEIVSLCPLTCKRAIAASQAMGRLSRTSLALVQGRAMWGGADDTPALGPDLAGGFELVLPVDGELDVTLVSDDRTGQPAQDTLV
jgi:hypothetical protein